MLQIARENQLSRFGTVSLDGTKIHAHASRHNALSYGHAEKIEAQLKAEVQELLALAEPSDQTELPDGVKLPDEIKRREDHLAAIAGAKAKIEARAQERFEREQTEFDAKLSKRAVQEKATGKKPGAPPQAPASGPLASDPINLTDEESRIMKVSGGGFEQCYNAQAVVDTESMLIPPRHPGGQRQGAGRTDGDEGTGESRRAEPAHELAGRLRLLQREKCGDLRYCRDRAPDRRQARHAPSGLARAFHRTRSADGGCRSG